MSESTKNLSVSVEQDKDGKWSVVVRADGCEDQCYDVESREQGEELCRRCLPLIMPIMTAAAMRGEPVSFTANQDTEAG